MTNTKNRILLVEDDHILASIQIISLEKLGYIVMHVSNGEKAIQFCDSRINEIDIILMDINLGSGIDGTEAAQEILKKNQIPVIFISSHKEKEIVKKTEIISGYGYVIKNSGITVLDASIKMAFKLFEANQQVIEMNNKLEAKNKEIISLFNALPYLLFRINNDGIILQFISGDKSKLYDPTFSFINKQIIDVLPEDASNTILSGIKYCMKMNTSKIIEYSLDLPTDTLFFEANLIPLNDTELLAVIQDITYKKTFEEHLKQSQKLEALGQIAGGIAHDFNNILAILMGNLEMISRKLPKEDSFLSKTIDSSLSAVDRGALLTKKLLAFARKQIFSPEPTDLNSIIYSTIDILERVIGKQIQIVLDISESPLPIFIDKNEMENVILNLAINARDAMNNSGTLTIRTKLIENVKLSQNNLIDESKNFFAEFSIIDTGVGIPPHLIQKIFEPFFTTKPKGQGTGLGLSLTYGFVKQSKGHIHVYSEEGSGTCFKLYFPIINNNEIQEPSVSNKSAMETMTPYDTKSKTILVVDDEPSMLNITNSLLSGIGYNVLTARNAIDALDILKKEKIDLVISDIIMPGEMNGIALAKYIKQNFQNIKVILTSGFPGHLHKNESDELKQFVFFEKPFKMKELESIVKQKFSFT
jgi:signal transduction histidine kinase/ActR/RegA family two-component response regulator